MAAAAPTLPRWDMSVVFPGLDSPEFANGLAGAKRLVAELRVLFDERFVERSDEPVDAEVFDEVTTRLNATLEVIELLGAYTEAFVATDSRDVTAQARLSELESTRVLLRQLGTRYVAWVGGVDLESVLNQSAIAREHEYSLRVAQVEAAHQMSPAEEELVAALNPSAGGAWERLHANLTSQIVVEIELGGGRRSLTMSDVRNLAHNRDRETRRRAYEAEQLAWEANALPIAASLNSVKGETLTLTQRRRWDSPLDATLQSNRIDRETLEAMLTAAERSFPDFRRYLGIKARALGLSRLAWHDIFAPVGAGADPARWDFARGRAFILEHFSGYSTRMGSLAARAFEQRWIDAEPRPGKVDGAFCMHLRADESRILANFEPSYSAVSTLAHELGHAYHNLNEAGLTQLQRITPMILAETASIFCEAIIREAALAAAPAGEELAILEASLQESCQTIVDIASRFRFEDAVFVLRNERELSIEELNDLMLDAQRATYGEGLDPDQLHPYMWAVKPHYYGVADAYYNFPYMFGQLFGLGLYSRYREDPTVFREEYDDLLAHTGRADASTLAARFGIDLRQPEFWEGGLAAIKVDIDRFEALVNEGA